MDSETELNVDSVLRALPLNWGFKLASWTIRSNLLLFFFIPFDDVLSDDVERRCLSLFLSGVSGVCCSVNQCTSISQILFRECFR